MMSSIGGERTGDRHALLLSAQLVRPAILRRIETDRRQQLDNARFAACATSLPNMLSGRDRMLRTVFCGLRELSGF